MSMAKLKVYFCTFVLMHKKRHIYIYRHTQITTNMAAGLLIYRDGMFHILYVAYDKKVDIKIHVTRNVRFSHTVTLMFIVHLTRLSATQTVQR
jgi:hypothetical protein